MLAATILAAAALAAWLALLLRPARPCDLRPVAEEEPAAPEPPSWPAVCAVVPARDEAELLPVTLAALRAQDYRGPFRIVVVDDRSSDATAAVARAAGVEVVAGAPLPEGWVGKVWALEQGARAAGREVEHLLLSDADIRHAPVSLGRLVAESEAGRLDLVSRMARLRVETRWEALLVPAFVLFFNCLYPMRRVNAGRAAAAAGGCVLLRRSALERAGGFAAIRGELIDDVNLARRVRAAGGRLRLATSATDVASLRAHGSLGALWGMVRRTAFVQLRRSSALLALTLAGLALLFPLPPAALVLGAGRGDLALALLGAAGWAAQALAYLVPVRRYGLRARWAWTLPLAGLLYGAITLDSGLRRGRGW